MNKAPQMLMLASKRLTDDRRYPRACSVRLEREVKPWKVNEDSLDT